jgi:hypothetical protein
VAVVPVEMGQKTVLSAVTVQPKVEAAVVVLAL